ncbi:MAG: tetratricopeptide repeat protein [Planctomycetota bacterium]|jgi:4-amino-4-deoxy-L-arabinose transferase-like glycosyltransferase
MTKTSNSSHRLNRKNLWICIGIFGLALVVRLVYLYELSKSPTFLTPIIDSGTYDRLARSLAERRQIEPTFFWQACFYPFFLSRVYFFTGASIICAKLLQILLGSVLCVLVYRLGQNVFDRRTGALAGIITALYGPLIFFDSKLLATGWASIWSVVLILLFLKAGGKKGLWLYLVLGICGGLSIITRATFLPFFVAASVWLAFTLRRASMSWKMIAVRKAVVLMGLLLVVIPVAVMCFNLTGHFSALPESGPVNLYVGNNPQTSKTLAIRPGGDWINLCRLPYQHGAKNSYQAGQFFMRRFWNYVKTQPLHYLTGLAHKTAQFLSSRELPRNVDVYASRNYSRLLSATTWKLHQFGFPFGILLPLTLLGFIGPHFAIRRKMGTLRRRPRIPLPIVLFLILYPLAVILVFVTARYRAPIIPVMAILAAAGFWAVVETIKTKRWGRMAAMTGVIASIALLSSVAGPFPMETYNYEAEMHYCLGFKYRSQRRIGESVFHLSEALRLNPRYSAAHKTLGHVLYNQGKTQEAIEHFEKALEINPELHPVHYYWGIALLDIGKVDQAVKHVREALYHAEASGEKTWAAKIRKKLATIEPGKD